MPIYSNSRIHGVMIGSLARMQNNLLWLGHILRGRFARNVAIVITGTASAQVITVCFAPFITRIYGPEAYGLFSAFMATVAILIPVSAFAYPTAIVLPSRDVVARALSRLSLIIAATVAVTLTLCFALWGEAYAPVLGLEGIGSYLILAPLAMLLSAILAVMQQWTIRLKRFKLGAKAAAANALCLGSLKVGAGLLYPAALVLILCGTLGYALHAALLGMGLWRGPGPERDRAPVQEEVPVSLGALGRTYLDFPLYRAPQNLLSGASHSLPLLLLASFFGPAAAAFYAISRTVMGLPSTLIGKSVADVLYPRLAESMVRGESLSRPIILAIAGLAALGLVPFAVVFIWGPGLFELLFGADWIRAGEYSRWLVFFFYFGFITRPCVSAVPVLRIQRGLLVYEIFSTGTKVIALLAGFWLFGSDIVAVGLFSIVGALAYLALIVWVVHESIAKTGHDLNTS